MNDGKETKSLGPYPYEGKRVLGAGVTFGADPEFFFEKEGGIIGAEKVLGPQKRIGHFVLDGVQVELNPAPSACRQSFGGGIAGSFRTLRDHLEKTGEGIKASFSSVIELSQKELDSLSDQAKVFGCAPSKNIYDEKASITVNGATYPKRAAGGHIHLGLSGGGLFEARERLVPLLDILVGNTCVMIDRDEGQVERRKHYGRAGEFRLPPHGLEYRTLSNFWLRSYPLMSFVMGMSRFAVGVLNTDLLSPIYKSYAKGGRTDYDKYIWNAEKALLERVDMRRVREAIDLNSLPLAKENWQEVREFISLHADDYQSLHGGSLLNFDFFLKKVEERGLPYWFPKDPMDAWTSMGGLDRGWENFLLYEVGDKRKREEAKEEKAKLKKESLPPSLGGDPSPVSEARV